MTIDKGIPIKNIYYMLTYAFKELKHNNYEYIAGESFDNIYDLFAEILLKGVSYLLKQGLHKEYVLREDTLTTLRGKLNLHGTLKERISQRSRLVCEYDELTINNVFNQIIKATVDVLISKSDVKTDRKNYLRKLMLFFDGVDSIDPSGIKWNLLRYDRNTRTYQMIHSLCYFILQNLLLSTEQGKTKLPQFSDEHMNLLFQRFVLEYYKKHRPEYKAAAKQIRWNFSESNTGSSSLLPVMQSDITLTLGERTLIIDTKYYSKNLQEHFGKFTIHSPNFYQIHTYVMNEDRGHTGKVDGMLLYAKTTAEIQPDGNFKTNDGNILMVRVLDLTQDFENIKADLENLMNYMY